MNDSQPRVIIMNFESWRDYQEFESDVKFNRRFVHSNKTNMFFENIKATLPNRERTFAAGNILFRSQIGYVEEECDDSIIKRGYDRDRMKPLTAKASEGRANPKGIAYLYLASDKDTSMAELRPHIGQHISCAQFQINRDLRIIDCYSSNRNISYAECIFKPPQSQNDISHVIWLNINNAFTKPVTNDHSSSEYVPTQVLAELFKNEGYDGICCKSKMGKGYNFILFNLDDADLKSCTVMQTKAISFEFEECENRHDLLWE